MGFRLPTTGRQGLGVVGTDGSVELAETGGYARLANVARTTRT